MKLYQIERVDGTFINCISQTKSITKEVIHNHIRESIKGIIIRTIVRAEDKSKATSEHFIPNDKILSLYYI
jgi:hypothetical protein